MCHSEKRFPERCPSIYLHKCGTAYRAQGGEGQEKDLLATRLKLKLRIAVSFSPALGPVVKLVWWPLGMNKRQWETCTPSEPRSPDFLLPSCKLIGLYLWDLFWFYLHSYFVRIWRPRQGGEDVDSDILNPEIKRMKSCLLHLCTLRTQSRGAIGSPCKLMGVLAPPRFTTRKPISSTNI